LATGSMPKEGDELTLSYGDKNNDDLLQYFGFVENNNVFDRYVIVDPQVSFDNALKALSEQKKIDKSEKLSLMKTAAALGNENVLVEDSDEVTTPWEGEILRIIIEYELVRLTNYFTSIDTNGGKGKEESALGDIFLKEKMKLLQKVISKLRD
jgi:hypothetical protein